MGILNLLKKPTRVTSTTESLIDHIYTNDRSKISQSGVIESGISDHYITFCTRKILKNPIGKHNKINTRSMKNYSQDSFTDSLNEKDWSLVNREKYDVNISLEKFCTMFIDSIDDVAPEKEIRIKGNTEPWIDEESLELIRQRDRALFKSNQNKSDYRLKTKFRELRNKATRVNRKKKAKHFQNKVEENKDNPKKIWDELKTLGYSNKSREKQSIVLEVDNEKIFDDTKVASVINNYYLNVAASLVLKLPIIDKIYDVGSNIFKNYYLGKGVLPNKFKLKCVSESFVLNELKKINPSKSMGIDGIKGIFLRDGAETISNAITHIINLSIETGIVPDQLKYAKVKPLYKKNSRLDVGNYRPVSILCTISKILERAVYVQLDKYCKDNNLLYEFQSGFRRSYSTDSCLINLSDHIRQLNSQKQLVGMVLIDLQKAFDTVDHDILCKKLEAMGVGSIKWFESYLKGRKQKVVVNESCSEAGIVTCGVPQGSILGPLLFLCYINDMPISVKCKLLLYADDSALIVSGSDQNKIEKELSNELGTCRQWLIDNKLSLHLGKTEAIIFGTKRKLNKLEPLNVKCGDISIKNVFKVKYLGIEINNTLSGADIVTNIIKKTNTRLKFLYRYKDMLNFSIRKTLCTALIQCHYDYSCSSWYPGIGKTLKDNLQIAQNKMIRFILNLDNRSHIGHKELAKAGFIKVSDRVTQLKLGHAFKIYNETSPSYLTSHFQKLSLNENRIATRAKAYNFQVPKITTNTFIYSTIKDWNELPNDIKASRTENVFKSKVKKYLEDKNKE